MVGLHDDSTIAPVDMEVIRKPEESLQLAWKITREATHEILQIYPTPNSVRRQIKMVGLQVFNDAILTKRPNPPSVRILIPDGEGLSQIVKQVNEQLPEMSIRVMDASLTTNITIHIVDRSQCMIFELTDDTKQDSYDAIGVTLYSNSKTIVSSYVAIFESLWRQTELYGQIKEANTRFAALNAELSSAYERLQSQERMEREFVNIAAHELKTPMMPIMAVAEIMESKLQAGKKVLVDPRDANILVRNAKRLERLAQDILDIAKIESNTLGLNKRVVDIGKAVSAIIQDFQNEFSEKHLRIKHDLPRAIFVEADIERLHQVIGNLLSNAVKFTDAGTITVSIRTHSAPGAGEVTLSIRDTGKGIDPEILPKLFARFTTRSESGLGLGLYISKRIIEAHGGKIWAENNVDGKGATFTFTLPLPAARDQSPKLHHHGDKKAARVRKGERNVPR